MSKSIKTIGKPCKNCGATLQYGRGICVACGKYVPRASTKLSNKAAKLSIRQKNQAISDYKLVEMNKWCERHRNALPHERIAASQRIAMQANKI